MILAVLTLQQGVTGDWQIDSESQFSGCMYPPPHMHVSSSSYELADRTQNPSDTRKALKRFD